jgi:hypothetical protein
VTTPPADVQRVKDVLGRLKSALDARGLVTDPELRRRIVEAHQDVDWSLDAQVIVDLGPPATSEQLHALQALWDARFAAKLPDDYRAFLQQHDGLAVREAEPADVERPADYQADPTQFTAHSVMTCRAVCEWLESVVYEETHPDGRRIVKDPRFAPFFEIDSDWFGFDFKAGVTSQPPNAFADGEVLWKPALEPVATSFASWLERLAARGFHSIALMLPDELPQSEGLRVPPASEPPPKRSVPRQEATLSVPLVLTRPKLGVLVGALLSGAFLVLSVAWQRMSMQALLALALFAYCVWRLRSSRYSVEIDERGVYDGALGRPRLAWSSVADVSFEGSEAAGRLVLKLKGPPSEEVRIVLDGLQTPPAAVLSAAIAYWHAAK